MWKKVFRAGLWMFLSLFLLLAGCSPFSDMISSPTPTFTLTPLRTSTTTRTPTPIGTPTPAFTPTPALPGILKMMSSVSLGQGVSEAAVYDPDNPGLHRLVILDITGEGHEWNRYLPTDWLPSSVNQTELVVLLDEQEVFVATAWYRPKEGGSPLLVEGYRVDLQVKVVEAHNGNERCNGILRGGEPFFPNQLYSASPQSSSKGRRTGARVQYVQLEDWLRAICRIEPQDTTLILRKHTDAVRSVAFSPDGRFLASGAQQDKNVYLWQASDGTLLNTFPGHDMGAASVAFSPDGKILATGSWDYHVRLWNVSDGSLLAQWKHPSTVFALAFSPDGELLASGTEDGTVRLWRLADGTLLHTLQDHSDWVEKLAFSRDGQMLASGSQDETVRLWRVSDGSLLHTLAHQSRLSDAAFSPDGSTLVTSDWFDLFLWRVSDGTLLSTLARPDPNTGLSFFSFLPDGETLVATSGDTLVLLRASDGGFLRVIGSAPNIGDVDVSSDGRLLAVGAGDGTVRIWRLAGEF